MARYFIEVFYKGTGYSGFQIQQNANSIQGEVEKALGIFFKSSFALTGSSRTDAGVHALSNYFHFDSDLFDLQPEALFGKAVYNLNAILPADIVVRRIFRVAADANCRFDALYRTYRYCIYQEKDPFHADRAYYYPYVLDLDVLNAAAKLLPGYTDFRSFSKRNTQVRSFICTMVASEWHREQGLLIYTVKANRFLRGMVKGMVGTMLRVGTGKIGLDRFREIIEAGDPSQADFSVPPQGLFLVRVEY
jgi:tRNA pseudouridine38-40 synthase